MKLRYHRKRQLMKSQRLSAKCREIEKTQKRSFRSAVKPSPKRKTGLSQILAASVAAFGTGGLISVMQELFPELTNFIQEVQPS